MCSIHLCLPKNSSVIPVWIPTTSFADIYPSDRHIFITDFSVVLPLSSITGSLKLHSFSQYSLLNPPSAQDFFATHFLALERKKYSPFVAHQSKVSVLAQ